MLTAPLGPFCFVDSRRLAVCALLNFRELLRRQSTRVQQCDRRRDWLQDWRSTATLRHDYRRLCPRVWCKHTEGAEDRQSQQQEMEQGLSQPALHCIIGSFTSIAGARGALLAGRRIEQQPAKHARSERPFDFRDGHERDEYEQQEHGIRQNLLQ